MTRTGATAAPEGKAPTGTVGSRVARWLSPGRTLGAGIALLLTAAVVSLVLAGTAGAAPAPTSIPTPSSSLYTPGLETPIPGLLHPPSPPASAPAPTASASASASAGVGAGSGSGSGSGDGAHDNGKETAAQKKAREEAEKKEKAKEALDAWNKRVDRYKADRRNGGVLSAFEVTDRDGNPVSSYRVYADTGSWTDWDLKIESFLVDMMFLGTKYAVSFACFLLAWSLAFKMAGLLLKPALTISNALYANVIVQIGLPGLCLTYAGTVAAWHLMFGRRARGWGEAAASLVISALALTTLAAPPQMLLSEQHGAVGSARSLAVDVAALILDNEEAIHTPKTTTNSGIDDSVPAGTSAGDQIRSKASALARPITDELVDAFVVRPSELLSYGQTFDGSCATQFRASRIQQAVADQWLDDTLQSGSDAVSKKIPWIGDTVGDILTGATFSTNEMIKEKVKSVGPVSKFEKACVKGDVTSLKKASMDKVGGAFFILLASLLVCVFIVGVDWMFLYAQICIAKEAMIAKCALAIGVLPGPGRSWLWNRATTVLRYLALMVLAVASLAVLIIVIKAILNAPESDLPGGVTIRFVVLDIVTISAFKYRKQLVRGGESLALRARTRLGTSVFGGSAPTGLGRPAPQRRLGRRLLAGGMMLGALAASGGAYGYARGSTALAARLARGTGRMIGGTARLTASGTRAAVRGGLTLGRAGLKSTVGLPVYGPRAARRTGAALAAIPGHITGTAQNLQQRLAGIHHQYAPPAQQFVGEYVHNLRSVGRLMRGRRPLGPYTPPRQPTPGPAAAGRRRATTPAATRPPRPTPLAVPTPARRRPVPPRVPQPAASPAQAALQVRLHRIRNRTPAPARNNVRPAAPAPAIRRTPPPVGVQPARTVATADRPRPLVPAPPPTPRGIGAPRTYTPEDAAAFLRHRAEQHRLAQERRANQPSQPSGPSTFIPDEPS
ncbi:hypothetical protein [Streptomyces alanosinicus]|uniref:Uncharacterized protein n=1 Tax=Streptomyces alanosinicus TaxID=68171 RepID=A0A919D8N9_9ACTN|nr:hypothetical protein [Streptomyces alanosinicus]GHE13800.1 hypothetical protein GCM10010339_82030 [Streptomyces alanosinicus]